MSQIRTFGRLIHELRRSRGLTPEQLAESSQLPVATILAIESGSTSPNLEALRCLCAGLELQLSALFELYEFRRPARLAELIDLLIDQEPARITTIVEIARVIVLRTPKPPEPSCAN